MSSARRHRQHQRSRSGPDRLRARRAQQRVGRPRPLEPAGFEAWLLDFRRDILAMEAAEARGDAVAALAVIEGWPLAPDGSLFWRPWRVDSLCQLAMFAGDLPAWVTSRWIADQAHSSIKGATDERVVGALAVAVGLHGGVDQLLGADHVDKMSGVIDRDWVFRQTYLYELGGLADFLADTASPGLINAGDRIQEWVHAPMGAFRLLRHESATLTWTDLVSGDEVETLNLGGAVLLAPGEHVLARAVAVTGGTIFESAPLPVPQSVATAVAACPSDWLLALSAARAAGTKVTTYALPNRLVFDVPPEIWELFVGTDPEPDEQHDDPGDELVEPPSLAWSVIHLVQTLTWPEARTESALSDTGLAGVPGIFDRGGVDLWPCVAAAVCDPVVFPDLIALSGLVEVQQVLGTLAERLVEPASGLCRLLLSSAEEAAG